MFYSNLPNVFSFSGNFAKIYLCVVRMAKIYDGPYGCRYFVNWIIIIVHAPHHSPEVICIEPKKSIPYVNNIIR